MPAGMVSAPLSSCQDSFTTQVLRARTRVRCDDGLVLQDETQCFTVTHDSAAGLVNVTVNCCLWNNKLFQEGAMVSANAYRCEVSSLQYGCGVVL